MKHISWKYIAGFVDGEGCLDFQLGRSRYQRADGTDAEYTYITPRLRIAQTLPGKQVLDLIANQCGGSVWLKSRSANPDWADAYYWQLENSRLRPVLQEVKQFLLIKRPQAELLIWVIDNLRGKQVKQAGYGNVDAARQCAIEELKAMKRDPQRLSERAIARIESVLRG